MDAVKQLESLAQFFRPAAELDLPQQLEQQADFLFRELVAYGL